jgi:hypothetical protein
VNSAGEAAEDGTVSSPTYGAARLGMMTPLGLGTGGRRRARTLSSAGAVLLTRLNALFLFILDNRFYQ